MTPRLAALAGLLFLAGCATTGTRPAAPVAPPAPVPAAPAPDARSLAVRAAPLAQQPGWAQADASAALAAFRKTCPALLKRTDASGLTQPGDWAAACAAAKTATDARGFFETALVPVRLGDGRGLNTGYYEPEIAGSRTAAPGFAVPFYRRPADLIDVDLGLFSDGLKGKKVRGRVEGTALVPYYDRAAITGGALAGRGLELAWAADPHEAFFLEIQGSGRLLLPDGSVIRIGFDAQNGRDYVAIGKLLRDRGVLAPGQATMDGIIGWLRSHPDEAPAILNANGSYIFFREVKGDGPIGALGQALTPQVSVAADPRYVPLGAPLWLDTRVPAPFARLMVAQDTGGAIKGANRLDIFWGAGTDARKTAGGLSTTGTTVLLLPPAAAARLTENGPQARR
ncbi:MAG TPA: MltA domain-containing protein [Polymorphobacter sp.]|nr:MltA domain-containing protein [Polymorphobacter sp.]